MSRDAGFSLVEMLAALAVLSIAGLALLNALTQSVRAATHAETRSLEALAAENLLATAQLETIGTPGLRPSSGRYEFAGRDWDWRIDVLPTSQAGLSRVSIEIAEAGQDSGAGYTLATFRRTGQ